MAGAAPSPKRTAALLALAIPAIALGGAYIGQYVFGLPPCEMCWWQRWPHFAALALALLGLAAPVNTPPRGLWTALAALAILASGLIGAFHAGVEYKWWAGLTACAANVAGTGNALDAIMNAPIIRCDVPAWTLGGISLAGFNFLFSVPCAIAVLALLARKAKA
jgi:disulfide bond formation protein DsbB